MNDWWRGSVTYQIYPRSFQDSQRRRDRRPRAASPSGSTTSPTSGSTRSGCRRSSPRRWPTWATTSRTIPTSTRSSARWRISTPCWRGRTGSGSRSSSTRCCRIPRSSTRSSARAGRAATTPRPTGTSGPTPSTTARRRTTGSRSSAAAPGPGRRGGGSTTCTTSSPSSRTSTSTTRRCRTGCSATMRFWLERGVDGFRLDTVNFYFHDKLLRDDPPDFRRKEKPEWNPYGMQYHLFSKNQPENLAFLERMRTLLDEYEARAMVGEMGESHHAIRMMGEYTTGRRLHKCYSFEMLDYTFQRRRTSAARSRSSSPARRAAGRPGRSRTTTWCATPPAGRGTASATSRWRSSPARCCCRSRARSASTRARSSGRPRPSSSTTS